MPGRHLEHLTLLQQKHLDAEGAWLRQLLALAAGGLALLAGLSPPATGIGRYFLAGTWVFLGTGILAGAAATYAEADRAARLADRFREELQRSLAEPEHPPMCAIVAASPSKIYSWAKPVMLTALPGAVACLVTYATITTLR